MAYLVDATELCEPTKPTPELRVVAWLRRHEWEIVVDPIVLGEIRFGILRLPGGKRRDRLDRWFEASVNRVHLVPWDVSTGTRWASLLAELRRAGRAMPIKDSMIAATALVHGLIVASRSVADFSNAGVRVVDPFA